MSLLGRGHVMTAHWLALVLLAGWVYLLPPLKGSDSFDYAAPKERWVNMHAFDTAAECEAYKDRRVAGLDKLLKRQKGAKPPPPAPPGTQVDAILGVCEPR